MNSKAEHIRRRMLKVRTDIDEDVEELVNGAKTLVDWREYVRSAPLASAGLACALGFLVVPSIKKHSSHLIGLNPADNAKPIVSNAVVAQKKDSFVTSVAGALASAAFRLAAAKIGSHASALLAGNLDSQKHCDASERPVQSSRVNSNSGT